VEELAEVLAIDFDDAEGVPGPKLKPNWRWEDQEQALLALWREALSGRVASLDDQAEL